MAEYYNTRYITKSKREYVKSLSRRIRLSGIRAKVLVLSRGTPKALTCLSAFSWADITTVIKKQKSDLSLLIHEAEKAARDSSIHGIIISGIFDRDEDRQELCNIIPPEKDILCLGARAVAAALCHEKYAHIPCMAEGVMEMLRYNGVKYCGKHITLFGFGNTMRMLGIMLMNSGAYVSLCASPDSTAQKIAEGSDIIITKLDTPNVINSAFMNDKQVIIDLGINTGADGKPTGDVLFRDAEKFVHGIFTGQEDCFSELLDYIACEHVLKNAGRSLKHL